MQAQAVFKKGAFDSQNVAFWSVSEGQYLCYFRTWKKIKGKTWRWISRTASKDFLHWTEPVEMDFGDTPPEELYYQRDASLLSRAANLYCAGQAVFSRQSGAARGTGQDTGAKSRLSDRFQRFNFHGHAGRKPL